MSRFAGIVLACSIMAACAAGEPGNDDHFSVPNAPTGSLRAPASTQALLTLAFDSTELTPPDSQFFLRAVADKAGDLVLDERTGHDAQHQLRAGWYTITAYHRQCVGGCTKLGPALDVCAMHQPVFGGVEYLFRVDFDTGLCALESQPPFEPMP